MCVCERERERQGERERERERPLRFDGVQENEAGSRGPSSDFSCFSQWFFGQFLMN